jgi:hypothetical protein
MVALTTWDLGWSRIGDVAMSVFEDVSDRSRTDSYETLAERLLIEGVDGTATIVQMQATGKRVDSQPELLFELVLSVGPSQSTVNHLQVVSPNLLGRLRSGAKIPVKVDPDDHSQLIIGLEG